MPPPHNVQQPSLTKGSMNGLLSIPASVTQKPSPTAAAGAQKNMTTKAPAPKLKLVLRRLPPGLTQAEFEAALGGEWKVGGGKIDWYLYKEGKVSKDPSKPSRPSRASFRVTSQPQISFLSEAIQRISFQDARNTSKDSVLLGPPSLEFAAYGRVPSSRLRKDGRQGTIDQDPEFKDFLESLTNPITKATTAEEGDGTEQRKEKVKVTPLVQFLKDKKANKGKESALPTKGSKHVRQDSKDVKADKTQAQGKKVLTRSEKESPPDKKGGKESKADKAAKEAVRVLTKQATTTISKASEKSATQIPPKATTPTPAVERKRERGSVRGAAAILQRDLGIIPPGGGRRRQKPASPEATKETPVIAAPPVTSPSEPEAPAGPKTLTQVPPSPKPTPTKPSGAAPPTGPATLRHVQKQVPTPPVTPSAKPPHTPSLPAPLPSGIQAFLKHANPSQGITEQLLQEAFSVYGKLTKVEIDKRKGFGYLDFEEPEGLQKAIQASPVKIAQGQVQVLERKTGPNLAARNGRGGGNKAAVRGGHAIPAQASPSVPAAGRGIPQGPAVRHLQGPRGGRGRGVHRGGISRGGGHANTPARSNSVASNPAVATAPAPLTGPASATPAETT